MRPIAAFVVSLWTIGIAVPASAQPQTDLWAHVQKLDPGTEIAVTPKGSYVAGQRFFLAANETQLVTLNLTNPELPRAAKNLLRSVAESNTTFLVSTVYSGSTMSDDDVRLGAKGIFLGQNKVAEMSDVIERLPRDQVGSVTRPGGGPLVLNRPFEIGLSGTAVITWPAVGTDLRATVSVPITTRHSLEIFGGPFAGSSGAEGFDEDIIGFYGFQIRQTLTNHVRPGVEPFLSYGGVGIISRYETYCYRPGCVERRETHVLPPLVGLIGGGVQYTVNPRLALRIEADGLVAFVLPLGGRVSVGFTVPIGKTYTKRN